MGGLVYLIRPHRLPIARLALESRPGLSCPGPSQRLQWGPRPATRDLAHWVGGDSARVAKSLITTRPTLNNGGLAARTLWDWRELLPVGIHVRQSPLGPTPPQCNSQVRAPFATP